MKLFMKLFVSFLLLLGTITVFGYFYWYQPKFDNTIQPSKAARRIEVNKTVNLRLKQKAGLVRSYIESGNFSAKYCFLIDMRIASGKKRFFVYNLQKDSVELSGLVTHGSGSSVGTADLYFSNTPNSNCTSLGKYKIGSSYNGKFGLAYKLYGLDRTNSKAFERFVVLHAHDCVPNSEIEPLAICESWGCPTVSPTFLTELKKYIDKAEAPILLWVYY